MDFNKRQVQSLSVAMHGLYKNVTSKKVVLLPVLPGSTTRRWSKGPYSFNSSVLTPYLYPSGLQSNSFLVTSFPAKRLKLLLSMSYGMEWNSLDVSKDSNNRLFV